MKTTVDLPDELVREIKIRAVLQGRTVKDLVTDLLRESLGMDKKAADTQLAISPMIQIDARGYPSFRCGPNASASSMTIDALLKLEQDALYAEDLKRAGISL